MKSAKGEGFEIEFRWKEEVIYWEGSAGYLFDAGWGADPPVLYVPTAEAWQTAMPDWLKTRREIVLERLRERASHDVVETLAGYQEDAPWRHLTR